MQPAAGTRQSLMLAYMSRERDMEHNAARHAASRAGRSCLSAASWRDRLIDAYSAQQTNTHVEVAFPLSALTAAQLKAYDVAAPRGATVDECVLAFGAFSDRGVTVSARPFSNAGYRFLYISVQRAEFDAALRFALAQVGRAYDRGGASWRLLVWPAPPTRRRWWCASLAHAILQKAGMLAHYPLNSLDVDDIVAIIGRSGRLYRGMTPRSRNIAADDVAARLFGASPVPARLAGALVADAVDASCRKGGVKDDHGKKRDDGAR